MSHCVGHFSTGNPMALNPFTADDPEVFKSRSLNLKGGFSI